MDKEVLLRITARAARHHGAFTRRMALESGASPSMVDRRVRNGDWQRPHPGVYVVPGTPATWERAVVTSVFGSGPGAVASHRTAAHLYGLCTRPRMIEVTSPLKGRAVRGYVIHRSTDLAVGDVTEVMGIPTTSVERSLVDVGVPWGEGLASRALDEALRRQMTNLMAVANLLHRVARRGRRGAGVMRSILEDRLGWSSITQSQLEDEYLRMPESTLFTPKSALSSSWTVSVITATATRFGPIVAARTSLFRRATGFCVSRRGTCLPLPTTFAQVVAALNA